MEENQLEMVDDNITIWDTVHCRNQDVQDIKAYLDGRKTPEKWREYLRMRCDHAPRQSQFNPSWLPSDEAAVVQYFDVSYSVSGHIYMVVNASIFSMCR